MMTLERAIGLAQKYARADTEHAYTKVSDFMPHEWVVAAIQTAYEAGRQAIIDGSNVAGFTPEAIDRTRAHLSQPQPVTQGEAVGRVCAGDVLCNRYVDCYKKAHMDTPVDELARLRERDRIEFALRDAGFDLDRASVIAESATFSIPTGHRVVPVEPTEAMRTAGYLHGKDPVSSYKAMLAVLSDEGVR